METMRCVEQGVAPPPSVAPVENTTVTTNFMYKNHELIKASDESWA